MKRLQFPLGVLILVLLGMCIVPGDRVRASAPGGPGQPLVPGIADRLSPFAQGDPAVTESAYAAAFSVPIQRLAQFGGDAQVVAVRGSTAFVGVGPRLMIYDITDPAHPAFWGQTEPFPSLVINIAVGGDYAYVANYVGGVQIVRIADPTHPVWVATFDAPQLGSEFDVAVAGAYLYVANGAADLRVVDVSDPAHPTEKAALALPGQSLGVTLVGTLAYVAALDAGLQIVDVADPTHPRVVGSRDTPGSALHVVVDRNIAYVADLAGGVRIINVANPALPTEIAFVEGGTGTQVMDVAAYDHYIYAVRTGTSSITPTILAWDVTDPAHPQTLGNVSGSSTYGTPQQIIVSNGLLHVAFGLEGWTIYRPTPVETSSAIRVGDERWINGNSLDMSGSRVYINNTLQALSIYDASAPAAPARLYEGGLELGEWVYWGGTPYWAPWTGITFLNLGARDNYVYMLVFSDEVVAINVSDPAHPVQGGWYRPRGDQGGQVEGLGFDIAFQGQYAYIAYYTGGLLVLDLKNPAQPVKAALLDTPGKAYGVAVSGRYAYIADREGGLRVIDIADPGHPREVGSYSTGIFNAMQVVAWDHYVAVAQQFSLYGLYTSDLLILDVTDPTRPVKVGESIQAPAAVSDLVTDGRYAYIANGDLGLRVIDISDPAHPTDAASYDTAGVAMAVDVQGSTIYVGDGQGGVYILSFSAAPPQVRRTYLPLVLRGLAVPVGPTLTPTATVTRSPTPSNTPTVHPSATATATPSPTASATATPTNMPSSLPDLVFERAYISMQLGGGGCVLQYTPLKLYVCLANQGNAAAGPFTIGVNGEDMARLTGVAAGVQSCVEIGQAPYFSSVSIVLDSYNEVTESNKANNTWTGLVPVPTPPATCTATPSATKTSTPTATTSTTPTPTVTPTATSTPSATPTPTYTPTNTPGSTPQDGNWTGLTDQGNTFSFPVSGGGALISQLILRVNAGGACGVSAVEHYFYDIAIAGGGFRAASGESEIAGSFTSAIAAVGTYKSVISNPVTGCRATRTGTWSAAIGAPITITPTWTPSPTPTATVSVTPGTVGIFGRVTSKGQAAAGIYLALYFYNGSSWSAWGSPVTTDAQGNYRFAGAPALGSGQKYSVVYANAENGNPVNEAYLAWWQSFAITSYAAGASVAGGDFDIADVVLSSPLGGATVILPQTFTWQVRAATPADSYEYNLFAYPSLSPWVYAEVGYTGSFRLGSLSPGFNLGTRYAWDVWVYNAGGGGESLHGRYITFAASAQGLSIETIEQSVNRFSDSLEARMAGR